jgi:hypothetical protein
MRSVEDCVNARRRRPEHRLGATAEPRLRPQRRHRGKNIVAHRDATARSSTRKELRQVRASARKPSNRLPASCACHGGDNPLDQLGSAPGSLPGGRAHPAEDRPQHRKAPDRRRENPAAHCEPEGLHRREVRPAHRRPTSCRELEKPGRDPRPEFKHRDVPGGRRDDHRPAARHDSRRRRHQRRPTLARSSTSACTRMAWCISRRSADKFRRGSARRWSRPAMS